MPILRPDFKFIIKLQRCPSTDEKNAEEEKRLRIERRRELARIRKQKQKDKKIGKKELKSTTWVQKHRNKRTEQKIQEDRKADAKRKRKKRSQDKRLKRKSNTNEGNENKDVEEMVPEQGTSKWTPKQKQLKLREVLSHSHRHSGESMFMWTLSRFHFWSMFQSRWYPQLKTWIILIRGGRWWWISSCISRSPYWPLYCNGMAWWRVSWWEYSSFHRP